MQPLLSLGALIRFLILTEHLYLSGVWLGVDLRINPQKKDMSLKKIGLHNQNFLGQ